MSLNDSFGAVSRRRAVQVSGGFAALSALALSGRASRIQAQEATPVTTPAECVTTTPDENKAIVERYFAAWDSVDAEGLSGVLAPEYLHHWGAGVDTTSSADMISRLDGFHTAFPDLQRMINALIAEGDLVVAYWTNVATQATEFQGASASDVAATWSGFNLFRIECGMIAEGWNESDHLGRLMQAGVIVDEELGSVGTPTP